MDPRTVIRWPDDWNERRPAWPLAIARIVLGLGVVGWAVSMWFDVGTLMVPADSDLLGIAWIPLDGAVEIRLALGALILAAITVVIGSRPTVGLVVSFVLLVALQRRSPLILNSGDLILRDLTLLLAFTPTGAALSRDRVRRLGRDALWTSGQVSPWGLRLVQIQIMVVYLFAFWSKSGASWTGGTAVSTALRLRDLQRFGQIDVLVDNIWVVALLTWSTLVIELALGTMLWVKRFRPTLIVLGVALHLLIDSLLLVGFFGIAMIAGLMTFLDARRLDARIARWRDRRRTRQLDAMGLDASPDGASLDGATV